MKYIIYILPLLLFLGCNVSDTSLEEQKSASNSFVPQVRFQTVEGGNAVYPNSKIIMTFINDVNESTLLNHDNNASTSNGVELLTFYDEGNGTYYPSSTAIDINYSNKVLTITPMHSLNIDSNYSIVLHDTIAFTDGTKLDKNYTYEFTTASFTDTTSPTITRQYPTDRQNDVSIFTSLSFMFDEDISNVGAVTVSPDINTTVKIKDNNIFIPFDSALEYNTTYTVTLADVENYASKKDTFSFSFTTQTAPHNLNTYTIPLSFGILTTSEHSLYSFHYDINTLQSYALQFSLDQNGTLSLDNNISYPPSVSPSGPPAVYDNQLYSYDGNTIYYYNPYDSNNSIMLAENNYTLDINASIRFLSMDSDRACVTTDDHQVLVYDIFPQGGNNFQTPSSIYTNLNPTACIVKHNKLYIFDANLNSLSVYDEQQALTTYEVDGNLTAYNYLAVNDNLVMFPTTSNKITIIDTNKATNVGSYDANATIRWVETYSNYMYLLENNSTTMQIVDISNPAAPVLHYTLTLDNIPTSFTILDGSLVTTNTTQISTYNLNDLAVASSTAVPLLGTHQSVNSIGGYYFVSSDTGVHILDSQANVLGSLTTAAPALRTVGFRRIDNNNSYIVAALGDAGVELMQLTEDANGNYQSIASKKTIKNIGRVYDVVAYSVHDANLGDVTRLIAASSQGLYTYDIAADNTFTTVSQSTTDGTNHFGPIFSVEMDDVTNNTLNISPRIVFADYYGYLYVYTFEDAKTMSFTKRIDIRPYTPRDISISHQTNDIFVSLGAAGVMALDSYNNYSTTIASTPGYALQIADIQDDNPSGIYQMVVADYSGISLMKYTLSGTTISTFTNDGFIAVQGAAMTGIASNVNNGHMQGVFTTNAQGNSLLLGKDSEARSNQNIDPNDPVYQIVFTESNSTESNTTVINDINDPI